MLSDKTTTLGEIAKMGQTKNTTESRKNKHLNYEERIKIEALYKFGLTPVCIGEQVGNRSRRTIERELKLGMYERESSYKAEMTYSADIAQAERDSRSTNKGPALKIGKDHKLAEYLEQAIGNVKEKLSPYGAIQSIKNNGMKFETTICYKTVYNYLDKNLCLKISNKDLMVKKNGKKHYYHKIRQAITNVKGTSISDRPTKIDRREEVGHWEMDTVVGKQGTKTTLLVFSERTLRKELIFKIESKSQSEVIRIMNKLERKLQSEFSNTFKTITCDNGCEFLDFEGVEKSIRNKSNRTKVYFAHPYSSWERGTNENINKMIRRFVPKGVDIANYSNKDIERIQNWINNYPRRILAGLSANVAEQKYMAA
jgi:IS30 family transposase